DSWRCRRPRGGTGTPGPCSPERGRQAGAVARNGPARRRGVRAYSHLRPLAVPVRATNAGRLSTTGPQVRDGSREEVGNAAEQPQYGDHDRAVIRFRLPDDGFGHDPSAVRKGTRIVGTQLTAASGSGRWGRGVPTSRSGFPRTDRRPTLRDGER